MTFGSLLVILITRSFIMSICGEAPSNETELDVIRTEEKAHGFHRILKRGVVWDFHGTEAGPEFILPPCPCEGKNELCTDYAFCYCKLGYIPPRSQTTGELFLKEHYQECFSKSNDSTNSKLTSFHSMEILDKYFLAFPLPDWDCKESLYFPNKVELLYPYFCIVRKMIPIKGTFYPALPPSMLSLTKTEAQKFFTSMKPSYSWPIRENKYGSSSSSKETVFHSEEEDWKSRLSRISTQDGLDFKISGGKPCFDEFGVHRRGTSAYYQCLIHLNLNSTYEKTDCSLITSLLELAGRHLVNIQLKQVFQIGPNGTLSYPSLEGTKYKPLIPLISFDFIQNKENIMTSSNEGRDSCPNYLVGIKMKFIHYHLHLLAANITYTTRVGKQRKAHSIFPIQLSFESVEANPKYFSKESRFWYKFYQGPCMEQFCWRDLFDGPPIEKEGEDMSRFILFFGIFSLGFVLAWLLFPTHLPI